jgi:hypothetical protein
VLIAVPTGGTAITGSASLNAHSGGAADTTALRFGP